MTVVRLMSRDETRHAFGFALQRVMASDKVRASSQASLARKLTDSGYPMNERNISDYMRNIADNSKPRSMPPMEFVLAMISHFELDQEQREDLVNHWVEILPEPRRRAIFDMCETLRSTSASTDAMKEMLAFERDRESQEQRGDNERSAGGAAS